MYPRFVSDEELDDHKVEPKVRCLRCNAVLPESELEVHRRLHPTHGPFFPDWTVAAVGDVVA